MLNKKRISIFGVTGSIGQSGSDVIRAHPDKFDVQVVTAGRNVAALVESARVLGAKVAVIAEASLYGELSDLLDGTGITPMAGDLALLEAAAIPVDISLMAIVGMAGLKPLMAAMPNTRAVAVANKEPLVAAGKLVMAEAARCNTKILPVDSEHNAIFQVLEPHNHKAIERIILTASGGPFLDWPLEQIEQASIKEALAHPNWSMGRKISIDSATMMNKALEVIEAYHLFDLPPEKIDVLIHRQSVIHSMVEYVDGSVLAQLGASDMRTPIAHVLGWPERIKTPGKRLIFNEIQNLCFQAVDRVRFPALSLSYEALREGTASCIALNAANEIAVEAFLAGHINFGNIIRIVKQVCDKIENQKFAAIDDIIAFDAGMRTQTTHIMTTYIQ